MPPAERPPLIAEYLRRFGRLPTVERTFRALPDPADHPTFRISSRAAGPPGDERGANALGRVAVVTDSSRGIGAAIAGRLEWGRADRRRKVHHVTGL